VVFSETAIGKACHQYIFSQYPQSIFETLDESWSAYLRIVIGPGIGICVPPVLACVLTRANGSRARLSGSIRDLREEYASSRRALWDHLEQMWTAPTVPKQLKLLSELERASSGLFKASFRRSSPSSRLPGISPKTLQSFARCRLRRSHHSASGSLHVESNNLAGPFNSQL
jgi:hypothetical protein